MRRPIGGVLLLGIGFIALVVWSFESRRHGTNIPPHEMFANLIATPVPAEVSELQGAGTTWQGYDIYLRFRAPSLAASGLAVPPYEPVSCAEILRDLELPEHIDSPFSPEWAPSPTVDAICLQAHELGNGWTTLGTHRVMYSGGWVHFAGFGS